MMRRKSATVPVTVIIAWGAFLISLVVLALKFYAYTETHSTAVLSDALETIVNVVASFMALLVMRAVTEPADAEHPYGHGKLEYFSSAFEGGLIAFAAIAISYEAGVALSSGRPLHELDKGMFLVGVATAINLALGLLLLKVSRDHHSEALKASGLHLLSDVWTSVAVALGLFLVKLTGLIWIDPIIALAAAIFLAWSGVRIVRRSIGALIDETEPTSLAELSQAIRATRKTGIIDLHHMRVIRSGRFHHVDVHMVVPEFWDVRHAHTVAQSFEKGVMDSYKYDGEIAFHLDPCKREFCSFCDLDNCEIRQRPFRQLKALSPESLAGEPVTDEGPNE